MLKRSWSVFYLIHVVLVQLQRFLAVRKGVAGLLSQLSQQRLVRGLPEQAVRVNQSEYLGRNHLEKYITRTSISKIINQLEEW